MSTAFNNTSTLSVEQTVTNVLTRYGADVIPMASYCFNWQKLFEMFKVTMQQFEQYVPCLKWYVSNTRQFTMPSDCQEVRGAVLYTPGILYTDMSKLRIGRDYTYDKYSNTFNSYLTNVAVQYLGCYTLASSPVKTDPEYVVQNAVTTFNLAVVPNPGTLQLVLADGTILPCTVTNVSPIQQSYTFDGGELSINLQTMLVTFNTSKASQDVYFTYTSKYPACTGISQGAELFEMYYAEKLLTSLGNIKAVCNFSSMANNITADDLRGIGLALHAEIEKYNAAEKSKWWLGIAAIQ